ncbi:hypothetical protein Rsub_00504 [Raphidocelis subcapitata]|uniref:DUF1279 domain-containing protein n=1 Tax=Raphidocelis subcapitata TaxID=307507 RepID=A0A2V0NQH8_9CHLO|nr:hypothetical protein Rsub_00504 [Raphidocelis subcapitata]|eukprot:GBF87793.1 hypothetical protein Rsub_00504 [Raphidocelis subcapitata]
MATLCGRRAGVAVARSSLAPAVRVPFGSIGSSSTRPATPRRRSLALIARVAEKQPGSTPKSNAEEATEKYGLEAGLFKALTSKDEGGSGLSRTDQAKQLLARYGSAYLVTSISFAIVSFAACYAAVSAGVDVAALLARVGLSVSDTSEKVGTFAIAYAAHKALSPVRFPPTVALTPVVAKWLGKEKAAEEGGGGGGGDGGAQS